MYQLEIKVEDAAYLDVYASRDSFCCKDHFVPSNIYPQISVSKTVNLLLDYLKIDLKHELKHEKFYLQERDNIPEKETEK